MAGLGGGEVTPSVTVLDRPTREVTARIPLSTAARAITVNHGRTESWLPVNAESTSSLAKL
ncbi:hypothetical protein ABN028_28575 [Actinopolymorpha sp. B17G11]|uniref:hypothetical protein n=1 Tax=unclassified Actinopolymorpha TaxID=2627063 RepID=UPI0032D94000